MGKKNKKNLPALRNPYAAVPPTALQSIVPIQVPRASFDQNPLKLWWDNGKRKQIEKSAEIEANIARHQHAAVSEALGSMFEVTTYTAKVADTLGQYEHLKTMRSLDEREKIADIFIKEAQAQQMGYEAKSAEIDYNMRLRQFKKMEKEEDNTVDV